MTALSEINTYRAACKTAEKKEITYQQRRVDTKNKYWKNFAGFRQITMNRSIFKSVPPYEKEERFKKEKKILTYGSYTSERLNNTTGLFEIEWYVCMFDLWNRRFTVYHVWEPVPPLSIDLAYMTKYDQEKYWVYCQKTGDWPLENEPFAIDETADEPTVIVRFAAFNLIEGGDSPTKSHVSLLISENPHFKTWYENQTPPTSEETEEVVIEEEEPIEEEEKEESIEEEEEKEEESIEEEGEKEEVLYWSDNGEVACILHAPSSISEEWVTGGWKEANSPGSIGADNDLTCEKCDEEEVTREAVDNTFKIYTRESSDDEEEQITQEKEKRKRDEEIENNETEFKTPEPKKTKKTKKTKRRKKNCCRLHSTLSGTCSCGCATCTYKL